jgi:hypothetical protein
MSFFLTRFFSFTNPLLDNVEIAKDQRHVGKEEDKADHEEGDVGVYHVVNLVVVAENETNKERIISASFSPHKDQTQKMLLKNGLKPTLILIG